MNLFKRKKQGSQNPQEDSPIKQIQKILCKHELQGVVFLSERKEEGEACYYVGGQTTHIITEICAAMELDENTEMIISVAVEAFNAIHNENADPNAKENSRSSEK